MQGKGKMRRRPLIECKRKENKNGMNFKPKHNKCHRLGGACWYV